MVLSREASLGHTSLRYHFVTGGVTEGKIEKPVSRVAALDQQVVSDLAKREDEVKRSFRSKGLDLRLNERVSVVRRACPWLIDSYTQLEIFGPQVNKKVDISLRPQYKFTRYPHLIFCLSINRAYSVLNDISERCFCKVYWRVKTTFQTI